MTFRYIGSKSRLIEQLKDRIGLPIKGRNVFIDAFCGTGAVAEAAAEMGWEIRLNDSLHSAIMVSEARLIGINQVNFSKLGGYDSAIKKLNSITGKHGFIWREYSPASRLSTPYERRYFTEENASKIDSIRDTIQNWKEDDIISELERKLLIADLLSAVNRIANIAGTFGCFLSKWTKQSQNALLLKCRNLKSIDICFESSVGDVFQVKNESTDVIYLDPPYTKRQYASYYHILETIVLNDFPIVEGVAGLRPWKDKASAFCYKNKAYKTLSELVESLNAERILISYSSEGHISMQQMSSLAIDNRRVEINPIGNISRYKPNMNGSKFDNTLTEFLVEINTVSR